MRRILLTTIISFAAACTTAGESDSSVYLTGTEEAPLTTASGAKACAGHKVLICHIPPGNPANEHSICVGEAAVDPHVTLHHDFVGACASEPNPPPLDPPPNDGSGTIL